MQVEAPNMAASSSPLSSLSSLVPSSVPSIEPAPAVAGSRAKFTYSRKPLASEQDDQARAAQESSSSSSQPASPSDNLFDSPMRSYGRSNAFIRADHGTSDAIVASESSPATTVPAANSAIKIGPSSLFRRVDSQPSQHSDDDHHDDPHSQSPTNSPAVSRTKKFNLGMARAIFDSDSDNDADDSNQKSNAKQRVRPDSAEHGDDDAIIARIRAQAVRNADSDPFSGSLSSVPPSSSQAHSSLHRSSLGSGDEQMAEDDQDGSITITRRRGAKVSAMKARGGKAKHSNITSSSDKEASAISDEDDDHVRSHKPRAFKLVSSASSTSATPADHDDAHNAIDTTAPSRREVMDALAARARKAHGEIEAENDASAQADPLLDAFFGGASPGRIPSRSPSLDIQESDEDEHNDAMPAFMAAPGTTATAKPKPKKKKQAPKERDILSDLEDDFERANAKAASKRATATKEKAPPKVKPLSKKEIETMHRQTARIARENRTRLAPTHQKKTFGLNALLSKIRTTETTRGSAGAGTAASTNDAADSASSEAAQSSSQIPSGQSKSQHASDPIESDPIPERSSPHPNDSSSPVVPMSRQQERRLGLDQSTSSATFLQNGAAGRVAGLATKQDQKPLQSLVTDDEDDLQLPDLASIVKQSRDQQEADKEAARKRQQLRDMKLRLLEKARQQPSTSDSKRAAAALDAISKAGAVKIDEEDDLEVYQPGSVLAAKHNLLATPGKKRPTDLLYREIGVRPGKTPPSRKSNTGTNANGSPTNTLHTSENGENADDQDDLVVTDSQLRSAGKGLFIATDKAAGEVPTTQAQAASTQAPRDETTAHAPSTQAGGRAGPPKMTQAQLNATLMRKMQSQSLKARSQNGGKSANGKNATASNADKYTRSAAPDVEAMLQRLGEAANGEEKASGLNDGGEADDDEDDPDYIMPPARNAESVIGSQIGSDVDMGSASEIEPADDEQDFIDMGSADEDDENQIVDEAGVRDTIEDADDDSEKENAPPPASQQSQRSDASPSLSRNLLPSRAVMDDDEDEVPAARPNARRARRSALADDDDGDDEADENSLRPGPFDSSRSVIQTGSTGQSQGLTRVPLGDISSQSIDQSMPFSRSNTSSPAVQHAQPPGVAAAAVRRDPLVIPPSTGQFEDESFRTDDIPSQAGDLGRFFEPTMPPPATRSAFAATQGPKDFWDQTQTQTQQTQSQSQLPPSTRPAQATNDRRELVRDESANSALGAFFQDTQQDELRGESLDIFENPKNADGKAHGFTQFFFDGTPSAPGDGQGATGGSKAGPSVWDASAMPPPKSTEVDAFAALRKAQMGEAMDLLDPTPSVLPSFDESQAEREAYAQAQANGQMANRSPEKMYMNRDGFFTQTKPSQQVGMWSQYDTQSQSQSQQQGAGGASGMWPSPAARRGSARRDSGISDGGADPIASVFDEDEDEDAPVQLKRLRRGGAHHAVAQKTDQQEDDVESEFDDENGPPSSQPEPKTRNAFDVLREGPLQVAFDDEPVNKGKKRKSAFIEGEAEESEDEELGGQKRGDGGGLKGVFGDDKDSVSGADEDEDDEDDADAADLQELVDNERDLDEAEKDEAARARFREDMEAQDREDLELHQKAIQGAYRNRRRGAGLNGIEGFLDEDADDEELKRRAALGSHANMSAWKKRKLLDGTEDGMDALAAHEEAQAFVKSYAATHVVDHESEKYDFLTMAAADRDSDEDEDMDAEEERDADEEEEEGDGLEEDAFGPVVTKQPRKIGYQDVASIVRERRKAKHRSALDDDEDQEEERARRSGDGWDSDEDDTEARLANALHDRIKGVGATRNGTVQPSLVAQPNRRTQLGVQYGRKSSRTVDAALDSVESMDVDTQASTHEATLDDMDDDDGVGSGSLMARLLSRRPAPRPSTLRSSSSLATPTDTLEDAEPEWGNDANIVRAPKPTAGGGAGSQSSASASKLAFGGAGGKADKAKTGKERGTGRAGSMLLSKQAIMRRESGFSSSSSSSSLR
ncbi:MRC1 domain-containing protein [Pseudozyma hubeiensis]|nr:MRC1 domain-containing protein [Pseudozyma hubeiensis]